MIDVNKPIRVKNKETLIVEVITFWEKAVLCKIKDKSPAINLWFDCNSGKCLSPFIDLEIENIPELSVEDKIKGVLMTTIFNTLGSDKMGFGVELIKNLKEVGLIKYD